MPRIPATPMYDIPILPEAYQITPQWINEEMASLCGGAIIPELCVCFPQKGLHIILIVVNVYCLYISLCGWLVSRGTQFLKFFV